VAGRREIQGAADHAATAGELEIEVELDRACSSMASISRSQPAFWASLSSASTIGAPLCRAEMRQPERRHVLQPEHEAHGCRSYAPLRA
jgi:hypothetical protein